MAGIAVFHELLEAVIGAIEYPSANPPEQKQDKEGNIVTDSDAYNNSHNRAKKLDQRFIEPIRATAPNHKTKASTINRAPGR